MKQFEYSSKSWHFRLARTYGDISVHRNSIRDENGEYIGVEEVYDGDGCTYIRHIIKGIMKIALISICSLVALAPMTIMLTYVIACITMGTLIEVPKDDITIMIVGSLLWLIVILVGLAVLFEHSRSKYLEKYPRKEKPPKPQSPPGFVKMAYTKLKDKTCFRILVK